MGCARGASSRGPRPAPFLHGFASAKLGRRLLRLVQDAVARFDIVAFAYGEIDLADRARNVMFIVEWPKAWIDYYVKSGFIEQDPIVNALKVYRKAFSFGDIIRDRRFSRLDRKALRVGVEYGWSRGLAVPVARGGERFGLVTMMGPGDELDPTQRAYLCLISECLLARIRSLGECIEFALPPAGMTRREIEAARLVALGCSDAEIALKLGVSEPTAHKHVESGRNRLKARSRAHMAGLCLSLGIASAA
jgi:DNA-binding CsgD family transcriptional regulator